MRPSASSVSAGPRSASELRSWCAHPIAPVGLVRIHQEQKDPSLVTRLTGDDGALDRRRIAVDGQRVGACVRSEPAERTGVRAEVPRGRRARCVEHRFDQPVLFSHRGVGVIRVGVVVGPRGAGRLVGEPLDRRLEVLHETQHGRLVKPVGVRPAIEAPPCFACARACRCRWTRIDG